MRYLDEVPDGVPHGQILAHNEIDPVEPIGMNGFRVWFDKSGSMYEPCPCGWAPGLEAHYRVAKYHRSPLHKPFGLT